MNALLKAAAEAMCEALNQDPKGTANRLVAGQWQSETFLEINARTARAVLHKVREGVDSTKADYAGDVKKQTVLDWLDAAIKA